MRGSSGLSNTARPVTWELRGLHDAAPGGHKSDHAEDGDSITSVVDERHMEERETVDRVEGLARKTCRRNGGHASSMSSGRFRSARRAPSHAIETGIRHSVFAAKSRLHHHHNHPMSLHCAVPSSAHPSAP